ncbi:MAG: hypothetical protein AAFP19_18800, partial [Bacteroidota bacterium]
VIESTNRTILSGFLMDFGTMAFPYGTDNELIDGSEVFTLKAEACSMDNYALRHVDAVVGKPTVVAGIPCPPYWVPGLTNGITNIIYQEMLRRPRRFAKSLELKFNIENNEQFDKKIRESWVKFAIGLGRAFKQELAKSQSSNQGLVHTKPGLSTSNTKVVSKGGVKSNSSKTNKRSARRKVTAK